MTTGALAAALALACSSVQADFSRNYISIVGSSTLQPFSVAVAEQIGKSKKIKPPMIESTGTGGGITLFCEGSGSGSPDVVNASRPMRQRELEQCRSAGAGDVVEVKVGYGGPVLIQSSHSPIAGMTRSELYRALAQHIPDPACAPGCEKLITNPNNRWKQINAAWPDVGIDILGPPVSSGLSEALVDAVLEPVCDGVPWLAAKKSRNDSDYKRACRSIRSDGHYTEETGAAVLGQADAGAGRIGIVSYAAFSTSRSSLLPISVDGVKPDDANLRSQLYPLTKPLLFYVKRSHAGSVPGLEAYLAEFTSDKAWAAEGYLARKGLVPMTEAERAAYGRVARELTVMTAAGQAPQLPAAEPVPVRPAATAKATRKKKGK